LLRCLQTEWNQRILQQLRQWGAFVWLDDLQTKLQEKQAAYDSVINAILEGPSCTTSFLGSGGEGWVDKIVVPTSVHSSGAVALKVGAA
jgi:hypothetical protein